MPSLNEFLKTQPAIILVLALLMVIALTPIVYLFAQQPAQREQNEREHQLLARAADSERRFAETTYQVKAMDDELRSLKGDVGQMRANVDVALKALVDLQKQVADLQKQRTDSQKQ
jgi:uncharacterized protein HemX